ncbi:UNVERIFIED_CONTAM: hypothetical protein Cloal_3885 [Acetivibrio alkalicellulosi]
MHIIKVLIATYYKMKVGANSARRITNHILDAI